jgi:hypothetical protein
VSDIADTPGQRPSSEDRWAPDDQLIAAVSCGTGSQRLHDLGEADRAWVVAGLTLAGWKAEDIRDRLKCSLRAIRTIRAADITQVCLLLQTETLAFSNQMALSDSEARALRRDLAEMTDDRDRLARQLANVIDARMTGGTVDVCNQGHLRVDWNIWVDKRGRRWCRECHAERQRDYRLAKRLGVGCAAVREARRAGLLDELIAANLATVTQPGVTARYVGTFDDAEQAHGAG